MRSSNDAAFPFVRTFETSRDVRSMVALGGKADIAKR
jgi:hypothetical protein